jgi:hypothetical protein
MEDTLTRERLKILEDDILCKTNKLQISINNLSSKNLRRRYSA